MGVTPTQSSAGGTDRFGANGALSQTDKFRTLAIFSVALILPYAVLLSATRFVCEQSPSVALAMGSGAAVLLIGLPLLAQGLWPRLASFNKVWLPRRRSDLLWAAGMVLATVIWGTLGNRLLPRVSWLYPPRHVAVFSAFLLSPVAMLLLWAVGVVALPSAEEIFWRGYSIEQLQKLTHSGVALVVQAALFAMAHLRPLGPSFVMFGYGLIFGIWRQRMRSLIPVMVAHMVINALFFTPVVIDGYRWYRDVQVLKRLGVDLEDEMRRVASNPTCRDISRLIGTPAEKAVPQLIEYLGHQDETVRYFAAGMLMSTYRDEGCQFYGEALDAENPRIVREVLFLVGFSRCSDLAAKVRTVIMSTSSLELARAGLAALWDLADLRAIRLIARDHPVEEVRQRASRMLEWGRPDE